MSEGFLHVYCARCRETRMLHDPAFVRLRNERSALKGPCPACTTTLYRLIDTQRLQAIFKALPH